MKKNLLIPQDLVIIIIVIAGILIAMFVDDSAFSIIGLSIAILAAIGLGMQIYQRMGSETPAQKFKSVLPNLRVKEHQDSKAKRQVIEGFDNEFGPEKQQMPEPKIEEDEDDGFRIIKSKPADKKIDAKKQDQKSNSEQSAPKKSEIVKDKPIQEAKKQDTPQAKPEKPVQQTLDFQEPAQDTIEPEEKERGLEREDEGFRIKSGDPEEVKPQRIQPERKATVIENNTYKPQTAQNKAVKTIAAEKPEQKEAAEEKKYRSEDVSLPISVLMENEEVFGDEPRKEFEYFLSRVLMIIRTVTSTRTACFLLVNHDRQQLILESYVSDVAGAIVKNRKLKFGNDIISQIVKNVKPEILTEINPSAETELIPYYTESVGTSSFIGVPVFFHEEVVGILCADSSFKNAYDATIVGFLGHFTKLISALVKSYTQKFDLMQDSVILNAVRQFQTITQSDSFLFDDIAEKIVKSAAKVFENKTIGICAPGEDEDKKWYIRVLKMKPGTTSDILNLPVNRTKSLLSRTINDQEMVNMIAGPKTLRISEGEKQGKRLFVSLPIISGKRLHGVLFMEGDDPSVLNDGEMDILRELCHQANLSFDILSMKQMMQKYPLINDDNGLYNTPAFINRMREEIIRSADQSIPMSLCLLKIDRYSTLDPEKHEGRSEKVLDHVLRIIRKRTKKYDIVGRADSNVFGIAKIGLSSGDAKMWAEKLRSEIAISLINIDGSSFTVTVSIGLAESFGLNSYEELLENVSQTLEISAEKTNTVTVYT